MFGKNGVKLRKFAKMAVAVFISFNLVCPTSFASDRYYDIFKRMDQNLNNGRGYTDSSSTDVLAWGEADLLTNYLDRYEELKDSHWIDKFTEHVDRMQATASDIDGDGRLGWGSYKYAMDLMRNADYTIDGPENQAANLISNGGFEVGDGGDDTLPQGWTRVNASSSLIYRSNASGDKNSGACGLVLKSDGTSDAYIEQRIYNYKVYHSYNVEYYAKINNIRVVPVIEIWDYTAGKKVDGYSYQPQFDTQQFTKMNFNWNCNSVETHDIRVRIKFTVPDRSAWEARVDDVSIKLTSFIDNDLNNGEMDIPNGQDQTLPDGWVRYQSDSTHVYRSAAEGEYYAGTSGAVVKSDGIQWKALDQNFNFIPGQKYRVSFFGRTSSPAATGRVQAMWYPSGGGSSSLGSRTFSGITWDSFYFDFTAPSTLAGTLKIRLQQNAYTDTSWVVYYDSVDVRPIENVKMSYITNGHLEKADGTDGTLPYGWVRVGSPSYAYRSGTAGSFYTGQYGMVIGSNGSSEQSLKKQITNYIPYNSYTVNLMIRTVGDFSTNDVMVEVIDASDNNRVLNTVSIIQEDFTDWKFKRMSFDAPAENHTIYLRVKQKYYTYSGCTIYADNIEVRPTFIYYNSMIGNGDFITANLAKWQLEGDGGSYIYSSGVPREFYKSTNGAVIKSDGSTVKYLKQQVYYVPNANYELSFYAKSNKPEATGKVEIYDQTGGTVLASATFAGAEGEDWRLYNLSFTAPSAEGDRLFVRFSQNSSSHNDWVIYVDTVSLYPDAKTIPAGWNRTGSTGSTAYVTDCLVIGSKAGGTPQYIEQDIRGYSPGKSHAVIYSAMVNKSAAQGKISVIDTFNSQVLAQTTFNNTTSSGMSSYLYFTAPADTGHIIKLRLEQTTVADDTSFAYFYYTNVKEYSEYFVHDSYIFVPILRFIHAVRQNSQLSAYSTKADSYLTFFENNFIGKWDSCWRDVDANTGIYISPEDSKNILMGRSLPHNQYLIWAVVELYYGDIKGGSTKTAYYEHAAKILNAFKSKMQVVNNSSYIYQDQAYNWKYWDPFGEWDHGYWYVPGAAEDTGHSNIDLLAILEAYARGVVFSGSDMQKITSTLIDVMWNGSTDNSMIGGKLNTRGNDYYNDVLRYSSNGPRWVDMTQNYQPAWDAVKGVFNLKTGRFHMAGNISRWNPETNANSSFEAFDSADSTLPSMWKRLNGGSANQYRDTDVKYFGNAGATIKTDGTTWLYLYKDIKNYVPNSAYTIKFYAKKGSAAQSTNPRASVENATADTVLAYADVFSDSWTEQSFTFTTPANGTDVLRIRLYGDIYTTADEYLHFDDVRVYPSLWDSNVVNGSFEMPDPFFTTLPLYWSKGVTTLDAKAGLDSAVYYQGLNSAMVQRDTAAGEQELIQQWQGYEPNAGYRLSFYAKVDSAGGVGKVYIKNETTGIVLAARNITETSWQQYSVDFNTPAAYTDVVKVYITHETSSQEGRKVYVDELSVVKD